MAIEVTASFRCLALVAILVGLSACARIGDLKYYPEQGQRVDSSFVDDALRNGATSCRYNLEDMAIHAIGDRGWSGNARYPEVDADKRPLAGLYVTKYPDGDQSHLQWVIGKDASGFCSEFWTETRFWKFSCDRVIRTHERYSSADRTQAGDSILLDIGSGKAIGLRVLLTPLTKRTCLVTEAEMTLRSDPDSKAREWIEEDHGYDPDSPP